MKRIVSILLLGAGVASSASLPYPIVDTEQDRCFDQRGAIAAPKPGEPFYGQDAQFAINPAKYVRSPDGRTVRDEVTGLTWQQSPDTDGDGRVTRADKLTWEQMQDLPAKLNAAKFGGFTDWRLPTIKELYSLFDCRGVDPSGYQGTDTSGLRPFIDTNFFGFAYGDVSAGMRIIDSQYGSCTKYVGQSARGGSKVFGVNFPDGRIKGYDQQMPGGDRKFMFFVQCVRGNPAYGKNDFVDNRDGTVTDRATGLTWSKGDSAKGLNWQAALAWVQQKNAEKFLGHADWRLPTIKELQSIVDYTRAPDVTKSPAIDPVFTCTAIKNEHGDADWGYYWSGTTHAGMHGAADANYIAFGRAAGWLSPRGPGGPNRDQLPVSEGSCLFTDVHGAGAQRCAPKEGDASAFPHGHGPQGDVVRIENFVRLVRSDLARPVERAGGTTAARSAPVARAISQRPGLPPIMNALDRNADGTIDAGELSGAVESLKSLDANGDGKLTQDEIRPSFPGGGMIPGGFRDGPPPR